MKLRNNRKIHAQNTRVQGVARDAVESVAAIQQEKYYAAFFVNGYTCNVYNRLTQGITCSCGGLSLRNPIDMQFDEEGNASVDTINELMGESFGSIEEYGERDDDIDSDTTSSLTDTTIHKRPYDEEDDYHRAADFINEGEYHDEEEIEAGLNQFAPTACGVCFGTGYVGGYNLCFGNRYVFVPGQRGQSLKNFSIDNKTKPNRFVSMDHRSSMENYVDFVVTMPRLVVGIDSIQVYDNQDLLSDAVIMAGTDADNLFEVTEKNFHMFCTGRPIVIRVANVTIFSHLEIQSNLSNEDTYLEYPRFQKGGDINLVDNTADVQIIVSPKILQISPWDIIIDNTLQKVWRVTNVSDWKDRHQNVHGWEVNARVVQPRELFYNLPRRMNRTQFKRTTKFNQIRSK